jgi:hypothetical protein
MGDGYKRHVPRMSPVGMVSGATTDRETETDGGDEDRENKTQGHRAERRQTG